jgi:1-deoxy-D-xylulose-5-phosphate reductoisomerase
VTKSVTILGSTGSVGANTAALVAEHPDRYRAEALVANTSVDILAEQARALRPRFVAVADPSKGEALRDALSGTGIETGAGPEAVVEAAERDADIVMAAIVGAAGLAPTIAAVRRGTTVAFANKECLVSAGALMMAEVARSGATLLPVDSEHSAIFQVFDAARRDAIDRIVLTASGGPFRACSLEEMAGKTPAQAVKHPNWSMGAKISVDSATMMNKGLEVIEAHHLFGLPEDRIDVLVHPQSIVHGMVVYRDGSVLAQLGMPDMRTPIICALSWPDRHAISHEALDLARLANLEFSAPDPERFPALRLMRQVLRQGGSAAAVLNAANEVAVAAFLAGRIGFTRIAEVAEAVLDAGLPPAPVSIDEVVEVDGAARRRAAEIIANVAEPTKDMAASD